MKFLKKIFGIEPDEKVTANDSGTGPEKRPEEKRKSERIRLSPLHSCHFISTELKSGTPALLCNLSTIGAGFLKYSAPAWPNKGDLLQGTLHLSGQEVPLSFRIVYLTDATVGAQIHEAPKDYAFRLHHYFRLEFGALGMSEVKSEFLKPEPDGEPHLFVGRNNCEVFYVTHKNKSVGGETVEYVRFYLSFFANYIEGGAQQKTRYGEVVEEHKEKIEYKGSSIVRWNSSLAPHIIEPAKKFLENVPKLPQPAKDWIESLIV